MFCSYTVIWKTPSKPTGNQKNISLFLAGYSLLFPFPRTHSTSPAANTLFCWNNSATLQLQVFDCPFAHLTTVGKYLQDISRKIRWHTTTPKFDRNLKDQYVNIILWAQLPVKEGRLNYPLLCCIKKSTNKKLERVSKSQLANIHVICWKGLISRSSQNMVKAKIILTIYTSCHTDIETHRKCQLWLWWAETGCHREAETGWPNSEKIKTVKSWGRWANRGRACMAKSKWVKGRKEEPERHKIPAS